MIRNSKGMYMLKLKGKTVDSDKKMWIIAAGIIVACRIMLYAAFNWEVMYPDSGDYITYRFLDFVHGGAANDRPPLYPIFLHVFEKIFGGVFAGSSCGTNCVFCNFDYTVCKNFI